jgi:hypothetical protein
MVPENFRLMATSASLVRAVGPAAAIWIGNAISSQEWSMREYGDHWWFSKKSDIEERTGLSDEMQETARKRLREIGVLSEKRGLVRRGAQLATIWYTLDFEKLSAIVSSGTRFSKPRIAGSRIPAKSVNDHTSSTSSSTTEEQQVASAPPPAQPPEQPPVQRKGIEAEASPKNEAATPPSSAAPPRRRKAFVPPTKEEWIAHAKKHWPWWSRKDVESSFDYYSAAAFPWTMSNGDPVKDWGKCAGTCASRFKERNPAAVKEWQRQEDTRKRQGEELFADRPVGPQRSLFDVVRERQHG